MGTTIHLLGRPRLESTSEPPYQFRSRKSWALLAFLVLSEHPPTRSRLASLLFSEAEDPLRALRWNLSEIRRGLGTGSVEGDPVVLELPDDVAVDVEVIVKGSWEQAVEVPGLGADLLEGIAVRGAPAFESWLLSEQRHVAAASEAILHEAALGSLARGEMRPAIGYAARVTMMSPLDENHQALLIRLYQLDGDTAAAELQFRRCGELLAEEFGTVPGAAVVAAMRATPDRDATAPDVASIEAVLEAGSAAVAAGAVDVGVQSMRTAVRLSDRMGEPWLRTRTRLVLAEALIHAVGGLDEEGAAALYEADEIASADGDRSSVAQARAELGYVDFLRARYDRAEVWLDRAIEFADGSPSIMAKATTYLGSVASDRADYDAATRLLGQAIALSREADEPRREAFASSMLGRVGLLRGELAAAAEHLDAAISRAEEDHWLALLPWPQALRGEVRLLRGDPAGAESDLRQAFARACQLGDPCWEGLSARGLALLAVSEGDTDDAFGLLADARARCNRLADPYVWLDGYILDSQCELGVRSGHPDAPRWIETMHRLASRTGMRELNVRSMLHGASLGNEGDREAAVLLAADIDNPALSRLQTGP